MAKGKRSRRPGGHPAKVARRRERARTRPAREIELGRLVGRIRAAARNLTGPLDAELWASELLGMFWRRRWTLPVLEAASDGYMMALGMPIVDELARRGGSSAAVALSALATVDDGDLGLLAREHAQSLASAEVLPEWTRELGGAEVVAAAMMHEDVYDDARTLFLEARHPGGESHALGVLIDHNLQGMAKDVLIVDRIADVERVLRERAREELTLKLDPIPPAEAAAQIHAAMELTDMTLDPPVAESYAPLRALALLRADETPGAAIPMPRELVPEDERERLRDEFLAAPEATGFAPDGEEAFIASLIISFGADYVDSRPLRWSPVVVELFMADWFPRKVLADETTVATVPGTLDAWVRFAGRKRGIPDWAIKETRQAISKWEPEMRRRCDDGSSASPARELLAAAKGAGVELSDPDQLETFVAAWNRRQV